jgi:hypothetical protein
MKTLRIFDVPVNTGLEHYDCANLLGGLAYRPR